MINFDDLTSRARAAVNAYAAELRTLERLFAGPDDGRAPASRAPAREAVRAVLAQVRVADRAELGPLAQALGALDELLLIDANPAGGVHLLVTCLEELGALALVSSWAASVPRGGDWRPLVADRGRPVLDFAARFNNGRGGATVSIDGRGMLIEGEQAARLAAALDPGRASRGFEAEHARKAQRAAREIRARAALLADAAPDLAAELEGIAADLDGPPLADLAAAALARGGAP